MKKNRKHADTTVPHVPANEMEIMAALLKVAPTPAGDKSTRKTKPKKRGKR